MSLPTTPCGVETSWGSEACSPAPSSPALVLGLFIDAQAGTEPVFTLIGVGLGIVAGAIGFWLRVRSALRG